MFDINSYKKAMKNFIDYLNGYSNSLLTKIGECDKNIALCDVLEEIKQTHDVRTILNNREFIASLNPVVLDYFKIIEFFKDNDALDADQVQNAANKILSIDEIKNFDVTKKSIYESKSTYESELSKVRSIIKGKDYDIDYFNKLLTESILSDKDKLLILSGIAYESTIKHDKEESKEAKKEETKESKKDSKFKKADNLYSISALLDKYHKLNELTNLYKVELESLWKDKSDKQLGYAINLAALFNNGEIDMKNIFNRSFINERMLVLLLCCKEYQEVIDISISNIKGDKTSKELYDELEYYINSLEERLTLLGKYRTLNKEEEKELDVDYETSRTLFLLNEDGTSTIDFSAFTEEEIDKVNSLIDKSEKKGKNERTILLHKIKNVDFDILISKFSSYICSYVPLSDGTILILDIAHKKKGYDETTTILNKKKNTIKDIIEESKQHGTENLFESQKEYRTMLRDTYGINATKAEEVKL